MVAAFESLTIAERHVLLQFVEGYARGQKWKPLRGHHDSGVMAKPRRNAGPTFRPDSGVVVGRDRRLANSVFWFGTAGAVGIGMNIHRAIHTSAQRNEIVTLDALELGHMVEDLAELSAASDDCSESSLINEYWGTDDEGNEWRVHVRFES